MWSCWLKLITDESGILRLLWEERENRNGSCHLASNIARFQLKEARGGKWIVILSGLCGCFFLALSQN